MRLYALLLGLVWFLCAAPALAERIALVRTPGDDRIAARLRAELGALDFEVRDVGDNRDGQPISLKELARQAGALAALKATPSMTGIELWIQNPNNEHKSIDEVISVGKHRNDELLALRVVEILRARLLSLGLSHPEPAVTTIRPVPAESPPPTNVSHALLWLGASLAAVAPNPAHMQAEPTGQFEIELEPTRYFTSGLVLILPLSSASVEAPEGSSDVRASLIGAHFGYSIRVPSLVLSVGAGAGLFIVDLQGHANPPFVGRNVRVLSALPFGRVSAAYVLTRGLRVGVGGLLGVSAPRPVLRFNHREVLDFGRPLVELSLGLQVAVPGLDR